jgi:hypothetical protein
MNYVGVGYTYAHGDVSFDPVLELQDVTLDVQTIAAKYIRTFKLLDRSARIELTSPYQSARWKGLLQGEPNWRARDGFADPQLRFAVNLIGAPPLKGKAFADYRNTHPVETTVGAGLTVGLPVGEYYPDKLLNLGENRFTFRPELGVEHRHGKWMAELTGTASFYTANDEFWDGNTREQDPYFTAQGLLSYTFRPGLWVGAGIGYGFGGESSVNDVAKDDAKENFATGLVMGVPINRVLGMKFAYLNNQALASTGTDSDTISAAISMLW